MKRIFTILLLALLVFTLRACDNNNSKSNTISVVELTERENAILATTTDMSFVFDFNIDSEYKKASIWVEKYQSGKLVDDKINKITTEVVGNGSIIFATSKKGDSQKQLTFNIGISSNGNTGSISGSDAISNGLDNMLSVGGNFQGGNTPIEGEVVLASICYSNSESGISSLTSDFYKDVDGHMNELELYNVVYLIKTEFMK
ncbi:hypothetical protein GCM10011351_31960 [Paraliobacillus quinghaiensis]|uniref:Cohesin domain-containing protein n=1 Tax=Paraliobacillus quinghaiensis TaxID=470815 RepID=A0A917TY82_9BACI|nr:hypothetical protein [Paraliobacillus quinghaiensis]GGM43582.1 hypothetical protein GCM10011351_31960 [Paraliobacillus quinghaiensis]